MEERRFAIIIGINDYENKPLDFCVNDANAIADILEKKCRFEKEDIYLITSDKNKSIKDISGHYYNSFSSIQKLLKPLKDSIFFFFAGHGKYQFENSGLQFHDSFIEISDIYNKLNKLQPKYQCYVIDACESGGKVLTRNQNNTNLIDQFISKSSGTLFMYASTENESAKELADIKHGLFTYYFLSAINNDSIYDSEGVLTPNRIQDYIAREIQKESNFKQTPVIENRTTGYYPFAFINPSSSNKKVEQKKQKEQKRTNSNNQTLTKKQTKITQQYFPEIPIKIRELIFLELKDEIENIIQNFLKLEKEKFINYEQIIGENFDIYDYYISEKLKDSIVKKSFLEKIISYNSTFSTEKELVKPNPFLSTFSMIDAMLQKNKKEYKIVSYINWNEDRIIGKTIFLKSKSITNVSCGISIIVYQAIYGLGLATSTFYLDFNGIKDTTLRGPYTKISAYKINYNTKNNIINKIKTELDNFLVEINKWNAQRINDIDNFDKKSK